MSLSIDFTSFKNGIVKGCEIAAGGFVRFGSAVGSLGGRVITVIKSQIDAAIPYLQNPVCAGLALFAVGVTILPIADKIAKMVTKSSAEDTQAKANFKWAAGVAITATLWGGSLCGFVYCTNLGLTFPWILLVSGLAAVALGILPGI